MTNQDLVILIHGIRVDDGGKATVGKLKPYFGRYPRIRVEVIDYGYHWIISNLWNNKKVAQRLSERVSEAYKEGYNRITVIGHSNGCAIAYLASKVKRFKCDKFVFINPALDSKHVPNKGVKSIDVWYNEGDRAVRWAGLLRFLRLTKNWGRMGAVGYKGKDKRVRNFDKQDPDKFRILSTSHSDVFEDEKLEYFGPKIVQHCYN